MTRWLQKLSIYTFAIEHRPGNLHGNADVLSRKCFSSCEHGDGEEIPKGTELEIERLRGGMLTVQADTPPVQAVSPPVQAGLTAGTESLATGACRLTAGTGSLATGTGFIAS